MLIKEAPILLHQAKVCHSEPIEKLACSMSQESRAVAQSKNK